jgi:hypothetical protein
MSAETHDQAVLYAAKSTEDLRGSIPGQFQDGRDWARSAGLRVVAEYSKQEESA